MSARPGQLGAARTGCRPPSAAATRPGVMLLLGAVLSGVAHLGVGIEALDRPIGHVDPSELVTARWPIRIKRASFDHFVDAGLAADAPPPPSAPPAQVSRALLAALPPPARAGTFDPPVDLRKIDAALPDAAVGQLDIDLPPFELSEEVLEELSGWSPGELAYRDLRTTSISLAAGTSSGGGGSTEARRMLRAAGLISGDHRPPPLPDGPLFDEAGSPRINHRLLEVPLEPATIDFAGLALESTTRLAVPDHPDHLDHDFDYVVRRYVDKKGRGFFGVDINAKGSLRKLRTMPKDVVFVIDTSSSVPQTWVREVVEGVKQALYSLNEPDRFNIVMFAENPRSFSAGPIRPATYANIEAAVAFLSGATSKGWTDVNAALSRLLVRDVNVKRIYELILISDGRPTKGVLNTRELINLITRDNDLSASIYCIGIGVQPNRELLEFLAYRNKGFCSVVERPQRAAAAVRDLLSRLRYPLIKDVRLNLAGRGISQVYPIDLPNIHQGERFSVFGRCPGAGPFTIRIAGTNGDRGVDFTFSRDLADALEGDERIARAWAFRKLHYLYSEIIRWGETEELRQQIKQLRKRYKFKTLY